MTDKAKKLRREYQREWQRSHPEAVKLYNERYWERRAAELEDDPGEVEDDPAELGGSLHGSAASDSDGAGPADASRPDGVEASHPDEDEAGPGGDGIGVFRIDLDTIPGLDLNGLDYDPSDLGGLEDDDGGEEAGGDGKGC